MKPKILHANTGQRCLSPQRQPLHSLWRERIPDQNTIGPKTSASRSLRKASFCVASKDVDAIRYFVYATLWYMIDAKTVQHIAHLARIGVSHNDIAQLAKELSAILDYVKELDRYDTSGVDPVAHVTGLENRGRKDDSKQALLPRIDEGMLEGQAPKTQNGFVVVPRVLG